MVLGADAIVKLLGDPAEFHDAHEAERAYDPQDAHALADAPEQDAVMQVDQHLEPGGADHKDVDNEPGAQIVDRNLGHPHLQVAAPVDRREEAERKVHRPEEGKGPEERVADGIAADLKRQVERHHCHVVSDEKAGHEVPAQAERPVGHDDPPWHGSGTLLTVTQRLGDTSAAQPRIHEHHGRLITLLPAPLLPLGPQDKCRQRVIPRGEHRCPRAVSVLGADVALIADRLDWKLRCRSALSEGNAWKIALPRIVLSLHRVAEPPKALQRGVNVVEPGTDRLLQIPEQRGKPV
mmetsp:Transcript_33530/g.90756  ORF Transcript_33530/g.90756 Transcript_33530/m.90756 type:complete len:293 (-) Transcript_33530:16-894(-)